MDLVAIYRKWLFLGDVLRIDHVDGQIYIFPGLCGHFCIPHNFCLCFYRMHHMPISRTPAQPSSGKAILQEDQTLGLLGADQKGSYGLAPKVSK